MVTTQMFPSFFLGFFFTVSVLSGGASGARGTAPALRDVGGFSTNFALAPNMEESRALFQAILGVGFPLSLTCLVIIS